MKDIVNKVCREEIATRNKATLKSLLRPAYCLFVLLSLIFPSRTFAQKSVPELWGRRVHDEAHVLKQETVDELDTQLASYEDSTSNQIAILIVQTLDGEPLENYSIKVVEKWKLGQADRDNGVLLLVAVDDHKMRIEVGQGLEGVLTDAICNRIIRNEMAPDFRRNDYDAGIKGGIEGIISAIGGEYTSGGDGEGANDIDDLTIGQRIGIGLGLFVFLGIFAFFGLAAPGKVGWFIYVFLIPFYTLFPIIAVGTKYWYLPGSIYLIAFPVLKVLFGKSAWGQKIGKGMSSGSSSGRWSSGSGSGWSSGGGGGSSFSGGGGSFGGGGSSGSW
jgi:uncharacterized protein